ncbi:MAG: uroporphyrinogen-III C-methyltransferase [Acidobacteria bacterium]|nr:uroporphyrinogen-III C-methyltransferase [Acidobacteriota bacterium]
MTIGKSSPAARGDRLGFVSLVGAGPGDPELLTLKAARRLAEADLLLYDGLVPPEVTALATRAQHFSVSKRAGRPAVDQDTIHQVMIRGARRGKRVVRLKNGDPFLLGRGGEEALALRAAGIPFEVVPGITAAVAAPALSGIPVTHRGLAAGFAVVSGHAAGAFEPILGAVVPGSMTVIVLMGLRNRERIAATLLDRGWDPRTPAAVALAASTPRMHLWTGLLGELGTARLEAPADAPGTIVVGEVANLSALIGGTRTPARTADAGAPRTLDGPREQARNV